MPCGAGAVMDKADILTPVQKAFLGAVFSDPWFRRRFYLTGGTALSAFHLFHRYSDDLDFFGHGVDLAPVASLIRDAAKGIGQSLQTVQRSPGFIRYRVGGALLVDVARDVDFRVGSSELIGDFMVDNVKNIAVNKVGAILGRLDVKDYVDLCLLLTEKELDIFELMELQRSKDAGMDPFLWASLIPGVAKLNMMPRMIRPMSKKQLDSFFLDLRDRIVDRLNPEK